MQNTEPCPQVALLEDWVPSWRGKQSSSFGITKDVFVFSGIQGPGDTTALKMTGEELIQALTSTKE